jgi:hypothetical protein
MFALALMAQAMSAAAEIRYVDGNNASSAPPYTNWTTAATNIQDAVDAAVAVDNAGNIYLTRQNSLRFGCLTGMSTSVDNSLSL